MRSDDDFREGTEKAARKESKVHPFVNGRRLPPPPLPPPLDPGQGWVWGGLGGVSDCHRHAPWGTVWPWV